MTEVLSTSTVIPEPKSKTGTGVPIKPPMVAYPTFKSREQFWWRQDGAAIAPSIEHMHPVSAPVEGSDLRLYIHGSNFTTESVIVFNDVEEPTTMDSSNILSTGVRPSLFTEPAEVEVKVKTGAEESNVFLFTFY